MARKKKKKNPKRRGLFVGVLVFCALLGLVWIMASPPEQHHPQNIRVHVEPPKTEALSEPTTQTAGDEKAQSEPAPSLPPPRAVHLGPKPEIAIVIDDMGLDIKDSQRAVALPAAVTLSYMPYATRLRIQTHDAHDRGHELLLHMPMEPMGHDDPGPGALLVNLSPDEQRQRFVNALASFTGFDGVNNHMGSKFTSDAAGMEMVVDELKQRGLFFLDSRTSAQTVGEKIARDQGLPTIGRDVFLDDTITPDAIRAQLKRTEQIARRKGYAVAIGHPHAITLDVLEQWLPQAQADGFDFVAIKKLVQPSGE